MADSAQTVSVTMLSVTSAVGVFTALLPPLKEVRQAVSSNSDYKSTIEDVRMAELAAGGVAIAVGITASSLSGTPVPAIASVVAALLIVGMYESILRATPVEKKSATK